MSFGDKQSSMRMREVISRIARSTVNEMRPENRIGKVYSYDSISKTAKILFAGETTANLLKVHVSDYLAPKVTMIETFGAQGYNAAGDIVRIGGSGGQYYIVDYISGNPVWYTPSRPFLQAQIYQAEPTPSGSWYHLIYWTITSNHPRISYSGTSTFTVLDGGIYQINASAMFRNEVSSSGVRGITVLLNGSYAQGTYVAPIVGQADYVSAHTSHSHYLPAGSTVRVATLQNSGGTVNVHTGYWSMLSIVKLD